MADRLLSQEEIDNAFRKLKDAPDESHRAQPYDFRRPDRIAKDQLRAIHLLHENFSRSLASSLSAYLRAYVVVNLVSVEQMSFLEFTQCLPSPTCMIALGLTPYDGSAVVELNPALVFPILEMLLGGTGKTSAKITRETTEIEQSILEGLYRIILNDLRQAWSQVATLGFTIDSHETEPQLLQVLSPNEAVVAVSIEVRVGDTSGMMNIGVPAIVVKMLRQRFDQQWSTRRSHATEDNHARMLRIVAGAEAQLDARLDATPVTMETLLDLEPGDTLLLDYPVRRPLDLSVNGRLKWRGELVAAGSKRAFAIEYRHDEPA